MVYEIQVWRKKFKRKLGRGIQSNFEDQALLKAIEENNDILAQALKNDSKVYCSTISLHLKILGKIWKKAKWIPHKFSENDRLNHVKAFQYLLQRNQQSLFR